LPIVSRIKQALPVGRILDQSASIVENDIDVCILPHPAKRCREAKLNCFGKTGGFERFLILGILRAPEVGAMAMSASSITVATNAVLLKSVEKKLRV